MGGILEIILITLGLCAFEVISSIDNAVVNADVLHTMKNKKAIKFFLTWGIFFAIFVVRGLLPFAIFYFANADLGIAGAFNAMWSGDPAIMEAIESSAPLLLIGGGMFLLLLFVHWLFMEDKNFGLPHEEPILKFGSVWFYSFASCLLPAAIIILNKIAEPSRAIMLILAATIGYCVFFITEGFKDNAELMEERLVESGNGGMGMSDWSKVLFLEVIDMTFSFDGVIGAFAFTMSVPLILLGNGLGAIVIRQLTIGNLERIKSYSYLKNGAMYSIGFLGTFMILEALGVHMPSWASPTITFFCIGYFLMKSINKNKRDLVY